jgi:hypothetical protein
VSLYVPGIVWSKRGTEGAIVPTVSPTFVGVPGTKVAVVAVRDKLTSGEEGADNVTVPEKPPLSVRVSLPEVPNCVPKASRAGDGVIMKSPKTKMAVIE